MVQQKFNERGLERRNEERLSSAVLNLDFSDLPIIVNGTVDDAISSKPFDLHFTKETILWSWVKIGFAPFTRSCLNNRKARMESGQRKSDEALKDLQL